MSNGGDFKPFRLPCGGAPACWLGPLYQHKTGAEIVEQFNYTTQTHVGTPGATSGTRNPYERWTVDESGSGSCESHNCDNTVAPCTGWIGVTLDYPNIQYTMVAGTSNTAPEGWADAHNKIDIGACHKRGFKNVAARRLWQGVFGFVDTVDASDNPNYLITGVCFLTGVGTGPVGFDGFIYADGAGYGGGSPPQVKFLERIVTINASETTYPVLDGGGGSYGGLGPGTTVTYPTTTITGDLDPYSGIETQSGSFTDFSTFSIVSFISFALGMDFNQWIGYFAQLYFNPLNNPALFTWYQTGDEYGYYYTAVIPGQPTGPSFPWVKVTLGISGGTFTATRISYQGGHTVGSWIPAVTETVSVSNTSATYTWENYGTDDVGGHDFDDQFSIVIDLGNENQASAIYADMEGLMAYWNLADDAQYPWRTDGLQQIAPLVSRLEKAGSVPTNLVASVDDMTDPIDDGSGNAPFTGGWTPTYGQIPWFDQAAYVWQWAAGTNSSNAAAIGLVQMVDGSIQGAPNPAGYQNYFRWDFEDWTGCCFDDCEGTKSWDWYQLGYGLSVDSFNALAGAQIPRNATQWTNFYESINKPPGASLFYADHQNSPSPHGNISTCSSDGICPYTGGALNGGFLWGMKYAEILDRWPSQNFARPAGDDKFLYDETDPTTGLGKVYCAVNVAGAGAGSTWTLTDATGNTPATLDTSLIWGGKVVGGFYAVTAYAAGVVTLGAQQYSLPSNWVSLSGDDDLCFGALRFPTAPSLLGRIGITAVADAMANPPFTGGWTPTYQFGTGQPAFGMSQTTVPVGKELVDVFDADMNVLAANVPAVRVDDNTFTMGTAYPTGAWLMIHGAAAWYMNDNFTKGDFVTMDWTFELRGFNAETSCDSSTFHQPTALGTFIGFDQTQQCLPLVACHPAVACFSPNGEVFPNGITIGFPEAFVMDEVYGSRWQGYVMATMVDLFWQKPHTPCALSDPLTGDPEGGSDSTIVWTQDDGSCQENYTDFTTGAFHAFYPFPPLVECRISLPGNYGMAQNETPPALPAGISIGFLSPVTYTTGDVAYPPPAIGYDANGNPIQVMSSDVMWGVFCAVTNTCRFFQIYSNYPNGCD